MKYREQLGEGVRRVVAGAETVAGVVSVLGVEAVDRAPFLNLLREELLGLETYNCSRYRLGL